MTEPAQINESSSTEKPGVTAVNSKASASSSPGPKKKASVDQLEDLEGKMYGLINGLQDEITALKKQLDNASPKSSGNNVEVERLTNLVIEMGTHTGQANVIRKHKFPAFQHIPKNKYAS